MSTHLKPVVSPLPAIPTYIVQAGGQGTRMEHYTWNKPKCLVPIDGKPLLYHLFSAAPDAHFIVIGDYLFDVLKAYIETFPPPAKTTLVHSTGKGTCAGISQALSLVEDETAPVGLVWCDLLFERLPDHQCLTNPVIGISTHFPCRWSLHPRRGLVEDLSFDRGVAGYFAFPNASFLHAVPTEGEFVRWLSTQVGEFDTVTLDHCNEVGNSAVAIRRWEQRGFARFFNDVKMLPDRVEKRARVSALSYKLDEEADWYEEVSRRGYKNVPALLARAPLTLLRIEGVHPDEINLKPKGKCELLGRVFQSLKELHDLGSAPVVNQDCEDTYVTKTVMRVAKVLSLVPGHDQPFVTINGKRCRNPFAGGDGLKELIGDIACENFTFFHGDPTFANMLVDKSGEIFLIDPRVSFGRSRFFGDPDYDWAKLYYSAIGDYDAFNKRRFRLVVWDTTVSLDIDSAGFSFTKSLFREFLGEERFHKVELLHALIWLSLAGYVDDDVDSMIAAFYNGLYWLEDWAQ